ncbi:unnamed protein product [Larinioides sclopetarius]|uniref:Uncharacterized protein n=1 Tax=Larinioides sclopetarius TaxID=280406 RepID=A0AAV2BDU0_9ARAC
MSISELIQIKSLFLVMYAIKNFLRRVI